MKKAQVVWNLCQEEIAILFLYLFGFIYVILARIRQQNLEFFDRPGFDSPRKKDIILDSEASLIQTQPWQIIMLTDKGEKFQITLLIELTYIGHLAKLSFYVQSIINVN